MFPGDLPRQDHPLPEACLTDNTSVTGTHGDVYPMLTPEVWVLCRACLGVTSG